MKFSTPDQDNDEWGDGSCVIQHRSAGWFNICFYANPNGQYTDSEKIGKSSNVDYIAWYHWKNSYISLKSIQLMIRSRTWYQDVTTLREKSLLDFFLKTNEFLSSRPLSTQCRRIYQCNWMFKRSSFVCNWCYNTTLY